MDLCFRLCGSNKLQLDQTCMQLSTMLPVQHGLDEVAKAFADRIAELQELTLLRTDSKRRQVVMSKRGHPTVFRSDHSLVYGSADASKDVNSQDVVALDSSVQAIELKLKEVQRFIGQEKQAINKAKNLISACSKQRDQLQYLSTHLPARLPTAVANKTKPSQQTASTSASARDVSGDEVSDADENLDIANVEPQPTRQANDKKKRSKAPRRYPSFCIIAAAAGQASIASLIVGLFSQGMSMSLGIHLLQTLQT